MDYFELLALNKRYNIDPKILNKQYLTQQARYHPDRARNYEEKRNYQDISIALNKAYTTLKDDLRRAEYLLSLKGININDRKLRDKISSEKLQEIWEQLEIVENTNDSLQLDNLYNQKNIEQKKLVEKLVQAFANENLQDALDITITFKYLINLIDNIKLKIKNASNRD